MLAVLEANLHLETDANVVENSHQGFRAVFAGMHQAIDEAKSNNASEIEVGLRPEGVRSRSTGKERDPETRLDYFGARYYSGAQGRFINSDPLMASGKAINPQSWNRYAYVFNNPLRLVDPDGLEVPEDCSTDLDCKMILKLNIIYDADMNNQKGPTAAQRARAQTLLAKLTSLMKRANIDVEATETPGAYTATKGKTTITGIQEDRLNMVFSNATPSPGNNGVSVVVDGIAISIVNVDGAINFARPFLGSPTVIDEVGHQILSDFSQADRGAVHNQLEDTYIERIMTPIRWGDADPHKLLVRQRLGSKRFSAPATPEAVKPKQ